MANENAIAKTAAPLEPVVLRLSQEAEAANDRLAARLVEASDALRRESVRAHPPRTIG
jgi:Zn-dependent protease with chaperone function